MTEIVPTAAVDGVVSPLAEARIPVMDRGFLYGDSIYEVFRTYEGVPLFFDEYRRNRQTGSFILIDEATHETVGAGMILGESQ